MHGFHLFDTWSSRLDFISFFLQFRATSISPYLVSPITSPKWTFLYFAIHSAPEWPPRSWPWSSRSRKGTHSSVDHLMWDVCFEWIADQMHATEWFPLSSCTSKHEKALELVINFFFWTIDRTIVGTFLLRKLWQRLELKCPKLQQSREEIVRRCQKTKIDINTDNFLRFQCQFVMSIWNVNIWKNLEEKVRFPKKVELHRWSFDDFHLELGPPSLTSTT